VSLLRETDLRERSREGGQAGPGTLAGQLALKLLSICRAKKAAALFMAKNLYVGNLAWAATADDLLELFGKYGKVTRAQVITDRDTGRSRGFGFVEMENDAEAQQAIDALNGFQHENRPLTVNEARPREERGPGGPRGDRGGHGGAGGGGGGFGGCRGGRGSFGGTDRGRRY
jgi:hypothetical protein